MRLRCNFRVSKVTTRSSNSNWTGSIRKHRLINFRRTKNKTSTSSKRTMLGSKRYKRNYQAIYKLKWRRPKIWPPSWWQQSSAPMIFKKSTMTPSGVTSRWEKTVRSSRLSLRKRKVKLVKETNSKLNSRFRSVMLRKVAKSRPSTQKCNKSTNR